MTIIDIDVNPNLEDFKLKEVDEQGTSSLKEAADKQNLVYYFVTPIHKKEVSNYIL